MGEKKCIFLFAKNPSLPIEKAGCGRQMNGEERVVNGVEQAFSTFIPECKLWDNLISCLDSLNPGGDRIALDNYESFNPLSYETSFNETNCHLAVGPERGWSGKERVNLREAGFTLTFTRSKSFEAGNSSCCRTWSCIALTLGKQLQKFIDTKIR